MRIRVTFGGGNAVERQFPSGTTVGAIIGDRNVQAALGYGSNVQALIDRRVAGNQCQLYDDTTIEIETVANRKAANISVKVSFGGGNSIERSVPEGTTVAAILSDRSVKSYLGFGDNVKAVIDGTAQEGSAPLSQGDHIQVETVSNQKANS